MATLRIFALALLGCAAGCLDAAREPASSTAISAVNTTCGFGCGDNGGLVDGTPFWGFYLSGIENEHHVRFLRYARNLNDMKNGTYAQLDADGGRLRVRTLAGWGYGAAALDDGILLLAVGSVKFYVKIAHVHTPNQGSLGEPYWTRSTLPVAPRAETYQLQWAAVDGVTDASGAPVFHEVCEYTSLDDDLWNSQIDAVVFEGEKYNLETKQITPTSTAQHVAWVNVACEGSLPAKMFLSRRTDASSDGATFTSTIDDDRQALVRAWAAEYCGNGISFTQSGHKLRVRDRKPFPVGVGWLPREAPVGYSDAEAKQAGFKIEAVWDAKGAVCLETPRMLVDDPHVTPDLGIEKAIEEHCAARPPLCSDQSWFPEKWADHGQIVTATMNPLVLSP